MEICIGHGALIHRPEQRHRAEAVAIRGERENLHEIVKTPPTEVEDERVGVGVRRDVAKKRAFDAPLEIRPAVEERSVALDEGLLLLFRADTDDLLHAAILVAPSVRVTREAAGAKTIATNHSRLLRGPRRRLSRRGCRETPSGSGGPRLRLSGRPHFGAGAPNGT